MTRAIHNKVIALHMANILRSQLHARSVVKPQPPSLRLLPRHFELFTSPYPLDPFSVHQTTLIAKQWSDPSIAIPVILLRQPDGRSSQRLFIDPRRWLLALYRAVLANDPARETLRIAQHPLHMFYA